MNMKKTIRVPIKDAESIRLKIIADGKLDTGRKIKTIEGKERFLEIPVTADIEGFETFEQKDPVFYNKWCSLRESMKGSIKEHELEMIPSGWQILGNIIVVTIDPSVEHLKSRIADELLRMHPYCDTVVRDLGIKGQFRLPEREILIGDNTETIKKENGCLFKLDVTKVMFSKGNLHEKALMSLIGEHETIVDMFAGIGYFTIPIAVHADPSKIIAIEINPLSFEYLRENITLNNVEDIVEAVNGNCAQVTPEGIADRVIMGYVNTTHEYLDHGIAAIKKSGGIIHYHETTPESLVCSRPVARIRKAVEKAGRSMEILECRKIKKYSPGVWHVVVDARII